MYLISFMVVHRHCILCKAPFHERLYELFGLVLYMPSSWECNLENTPRLRHLRGDDLVWSWQLQNHFHNKSDLSSLFGWENDHEEVVKVCQRLVDVGIPKIDNFKFQSKKVIQYNLHTNGIMDNILQ